jgi:lysozyme
MTVMRASEAQRSRTKTEEGLRLTAYTDTVGIYTIGWGHAATNPTPVRGLVNGEYYEGKVCKGLIITPQEAQRLFDLDTDDTERGISALISAPLTQAQFDALFDFVHQFGVGALGGSTLIGKINMNPNNTEAVFEQLMRWTRAGGEHQEYVWRRSARRCCVYNGSPIPQALWRKNGFPFAITKDDKIDYKITPPIEKIIEYGKKAAEPYKFEPDKIKLEEKPTLDLTTEAIVIDEPFKPAAPSTAEAKGTAPGQPPSPAPALVPQPDLVRTSPEVEKPNPAPQASPPVLPKSAPSGGHSGAAVEARPVPAAPPPLPPKPPVIIAPQTINPNALPTNADSAKNMADSTRMTGMVLVGIGTVVQVVTLRLGVGTAIGAVFFDLTRDPVVITLVVTAIVGALGWVTKRNGKKTFVKGVETAKGNLY